MMIVLALGLALFQGDSVEAELVAIERRLAATWKAGDCAAWGALLAPDWSVTHITGAVITRAEALEMCRKAETPPSALAVGDLAVRVFGDAAVVTGRTTATTGGPDPATVTLRFTDVFIRVKGRWLVVASHATRLAP